LISGFLEQQIERYEFLKFKLELNGVSKKEKKFQRNSWPLGRIQARVPSLLWQMAWPNSPELA
jgi:hypothetical protein